MHNGTEWDPIYYSRVQYLIGILEAKSRNGSNTRAIRVFSQLAIKIAMAQKEGIFILKQRKKIEKETFEDIEMRDA
jgi:uncharacterized protein YkuJ